MDFKYTINIYDLEGNKRDALVTNCDVITIGSGLYNAIRIHMPSINELHLRIYTEKKKVLAFGPDVFLNDNLLNIGFKCEFELGDFIKIHGRSFQLLLTDPNSVIDQSKIIKECPPHLYLEIEPDLFISSDKKFKEDPQEMMTNKNEKKEVLDQPINNKMEIINEGNTLKLMEDDKVKNVYVENNEIVTNEVVGDLHTKRETNIHREVETSHYIKEGVIYQEVTEKVNIQDVTETKVDEGNVDENETKIDDLSKMDDLKNNFEVQAAVKIIDASSSETKAEGALEEGDLSSVKEAIITKKEEVNEEIKDSIDTGVIVDTPIIPVKKQVIDLGSAVIEKEILKDAEKVVDEKINNEDLSESKINYQEDLTDNLELTKLISEEDTLSKVDSSKINDGNVEKRENPFFDMSEPKTEEETVFIKEEAKEVNPPILTLEDIKEINEKDTASVEMQEVENKEPEKMEEVIEAEDGIYIAEEEKHEEDKIEKPEEEKTEEEKPDEKMEVIVEDEIKAEEPTEAKIEEPTEKEEVKEEPEIKEPKTKEDKEAEEKSEIKIEEPEVKEEPATEIKEEPEAKIVEPKKAEVKEESAEANEAEVPEVEKPEIKEEKEIEKEPEHVEVKPEEVIEEPEKEEPKAKKPKRETKKDKEARLKKEKAEEEAKQKESEKSEEEAKQQVEEVSEKEKEPEKEKEVKPEDEPEVKPEDEPEKEEPKAKKPKRETKKDKEARLKKEKAEEEAKQKEEESEEESEKEKDLESEEEPENEEVSEEVQEEKPKRKASAPRKKKQEEPEVSEKEEEVKEKPKRKAPALRKKKQEEALELDSGEEPAKKKVKGSEKESEADFEKLTVEAESEEKPKKKESKKKTKEEDSESEKKPKKREYKRKVKVEEDEEKSKTKKKEEAPAKPKQISKLTVTPRSTRKASMATHNLDPVVPVTPKRAKRNASVSSETKSTADKKKK